LKQEDIKKLFLEVSQLTESLQVEVDEKPEDTEGVDYWVARLEAGDSRGEVAAELINAVYTYEESTDPLTAAAYSQFVNRVEVSDYSAETIPGTDLDASNEEHMAPFVASNDSTTDDAATVDAAKADIDAYEPPAPPLTFEFTSDASSALEGEFITYTVTASEAVTADTDVSFVVVPGDTAADDQGTATSNLNDFTAGTFNPEIVTIAAGSTTATFQVTAIEV